MALTHSQEVCRLYRGALKMSLDWLIDRGKWRSFALALRQEFDANKSINGEREKAELLLAGKYLLYKYRHPEPYICKQNYTKLSLILDIFLVYRSIGTRWSCL